MLIYVLEKRKMDQVVILRLLKIQLIAKYMVNRKRKSVKGKRMMVQNVILNVMVLHPIAKNINQHKK
jgi:hypothetical protein